MPRTILRAFSRILSLAEKPSPEIGPDELIEWIGQFRDQLDTQLNDAVSSIVDMRDSFNERHLSACIGDLTTGVTKYWLGQATKGFIFTREVIAQRLTIQANVLTGATLTVTVYNGTTEAAGNIVFQIASGPATGIVSEEDTTPNNAGKEEFRPSDDTNDGDRCFVKIAVTGGSVEDICVELAYKPI